MTSIVRKLELVIEVDGDSYNHEEAVIKDEIRQKVLEEMGLSFLRFDDLDVKRNMVYVLDEIEQFYC